MSCRRPVLESLLGAALLLAAPPAPATGPGPTADELVEAVRERGLDPAEIVFPLRLTEEMRRWVRESVPLERDSKARLRALLRALLDPDGLAIQYVGDGHGTAQEVFESRRANCLAFTQLFVGMAREIGLDAYFLEVRRRPRYQQEGDLVVVWEHVTAGYGPEQDRLMLEFSLGPSLEGLGNRRLSDLTALAMYYSNRGAQALLEGSVEAAVPWLETAVRLDPDWTGGWLNLGVARRRAGKPQAAERAYRAAIDADPGNYQAFHNLAALLRLRGEGQSASEILRLLDRRENRDPFIYLSLGDDSLESGRLEEARRYYRRALWLAPEDSEPRAAMGLLALAEGHPKRARRWLDRALRDGDGTTRTLRLAERLGSSDG